MNSSADRGNASIAMMGVLALGCSCVIGLADLDHRLSGSMSAQTVADAVALTAAGHGLVTARQLAGRQGALVEIITLKRSVNGEMVTAVVTIEYGRARATASAGNAP